MEFMASLVRDFLVPGSMTLLLLGLIAGVGMLYMRDAWPRRGRRVLTAFVVLYTILSLPVFADALAAGLDRGYGSLAAPEEANGATAIVVLSGGSETYRTAIGEINSMSGPSAFRTLETARVYRLLDEPWVVVSGGVGDPFATLSPESKPMQAALQDAGVPADRILLEPASRNTYEQAVNLAPLLAAHGIERFVLVTSSAHMWRALATFRGQGLYPIPSQSAARSIDLPARASVIIPTTAALRDSRGYLREYMALLYYWSRGWLKE